MDKAKLAIIAMVAILAEAGKGEDCGKISNFAVEIIKTEIYNAKRFRK